MRWQVLPLGLAFSCNLPVISRLVYVAGETKPSTSLPRPVPGRPRGVSVAEQLEDANRIKPLSLQACVKH